MNKAIPIFLFFLLPAYLCAESKIILGMDISKADEMLEGLGYKDVGQQMRSVMRKRGVVATHEIKNYVIADKTYISLVYKLEDNTIDNILIVFIPKHRPAKGVDSERVLDYIIFNDDGAYTIKVRKPQQEDQHNGI